MLTYERARELLIYDATTGSLYWTAAASRGGQNFFVTRPEGRRAGHRNRVTGYRDICIDQKKYPEHRVAWLLHHGSWPSGQIDHVNHDGFDNRIVNLRDVARDENARNRRLYKNNTSGRTGVRFDKQMQKWAASIRANGKSRHLGFHQDWDQAVAARESAEAALGFHENHGRVT